MAEEENVINLVFQFQARYMDVVRNVMDQLRSLTVEFERAREAVLSSRMSDEQKAEALKNLTAGYLEAQRQVASLARSFTGQQEQVRKAGREAEGLGRRFSRLGLRLNWFAYRLVMVGRIIMSWLMRPIREVMGLLSSWERTLEEGAYALGLLSHYEMVTGEEAKHLRETLTQLPEAGLKFQAAMNYLKLALLDVALAVAPRLTEAIMNLAKAIREHPELIQALVDGFINLVNWGAKLLETLAPYAPVLAPLASILVPLAAGFIAVGTALYFVSTAIVGFILAAEGMKLAIAGISASLSFLAANPIVLVIAAIAALAALLIWAYQTCEPFRNAVNQLAEGLKWLWNIIINNPFLSALFGPITSIVYLITHWEEVTRALGETWESFCSGVKWFWDTYIQPVIEGLKTFIKPFESLGGLLKPVTDAFGGLGETLRNLCFKHVAPYVEQFSRDLNEAYDSTAKLSSSLRGLRVGLGATTPGGPGPGAQYVTVYSSISIGTVSSEVDLASLRENVNRGIADALRRRL